MTAPIRRQPLMLIANVLQGKTAKLRLDRAVDSEACNRAEGSTDGDSEVRGHGGSFRQ